LKRLLDPASSDARVRRYFRGIAKDVENEATSPGRHVDYDPTAVPLIAGLLGRELERHDSKESSSTRDSEAILVTNLRYAHAKVCLASDHAEDAIFQLQEAVASAGSVGDLYVLQACQRLLVSAWRKSGEPGKAIVLLQEMSGRQRVQFGEDHPSVLGLLLALAAAFEADQQPLEAVPLLKQILEIQEKTHGQHHQSQMTTLHLLLRSQISTGQEVLADTTVSRIIKILEQSTTLLPSLQPILQSVNSPETAYQQTAFHDSRPQMQQTGHATSNIPDPPNDIPSLQDLIDHVYHTCRVAKERI
jgi:hypothetical protein